MAVANTKAYSNKTTITVVKSFVAQAQVFNFRSSCIWIMHLLPSVAIRPNLESKTWPKQLLGSLPLVIALPVQV